MNWDLIFWNALYTSISAAAAGYCIIASGLNVHVGYTGLLNFGQAGFAAIGAYAFAIPIATYDWAWYFALPVMLCRLCPARARARRPDPAPARRLPGDRHHRGRGDRQALLELDPVHLAHGWNRRAQRVDHHFRRSEPARQHGPATTSARRRSTAIGSS